MFNWQTTKTHYWQTDEQVSKPRILEIDLTLDTNSDEKVKPFLYKLKNYSSN